MFEVIGVLVVAWIVYIIIKAIFKANVTVQRQETGNETRQMAISKLGVPDAYYNHSVLNYMDEVKQAALELKEQSDEHKNMSSANLMAWTIYYGFRHDCQQYHYGNNKLEGIGIAPEIISNELNKDPIEPDQLKS